ncbi:hypothetical protein TARUN_9860 [Trichoderma arundinaceum]|uniref:F-box domain-containing protein n=1 Tax=Trichoderma arundinaceum TaxID=490622 RepID=A0A395N8F5_TRIAR|nr:hypothetical protein TARUN_9860 [Trichoderma arundinaceum]
MSHEIQTYCQLCGVIFNINRIRTRDEPRSSAWGNTFTSKHKGWDWVMVSGFDQEECPDGGCASVYRGRPTWERRIHPRLYQDDLNDTTYTYESEDDDEPLEYDSNAEDDDGGDDTSEEGSETNSSQSQEPEKKWSFGVHGLDSQEYDDEFLPLSAPYDGECSRRKDADMESDANIMALPAARKYEHIAGPGCCNSRGFHGDRISAEEMMDCQTVQGIFRKSKDLAPLDDDMDFERESQNYRLTGLSDFMPASGGGLRCAPVRGEADQCNASNDSDVRNNTSASGTNILPFHPTCFEIFIRISKQKMGTVSLDSLMQLRSNHFCDRFGERHPDVADARSDGWNWHCMIGSEYLAANPIFIPGFRALCEAAVSDAEGFDNRRSPFPDRSEDGELSVLQDPFLKLPAELKQAIVWNLDSRDIAALRLASRAFYHLPMTLWHTLIVREMPWVYEAWCDDATPYPWALADASDLKQMREQAEAYSLERDRRAEVLKTNEPDFYPIWEKNEPRSPPWFETPEFQAQLKQSLDRKMAMGPIVLPRDRTNWYQLYKDIKTNEDKLKGLRNRKRIWANVGDIVDKVKEESEAEVRRKNTPASELIWMSQFL